MRDTEAFKGAFRAKPMDITMKHTLTLLAALLFGTSLAAHEFTAGDLMIIHPHIAAPLPLAKAAGGYMAITNDGTEADALIGARSDLANQTMIHTTEHGADGVARMMHLDRLEIPAGETVLLEKGGLHVMFMGLTSIPQAGDMVKTTLIFEKAGEVEIEFSIDEADPQAGMADHTH